MERGLAELVRAAGIGAEVRGEATVGGVSYDSRSAAAGDLFCCVPGSRADGHDHAPAAVARGATALLVERFLDLSVAQARVERVRAALGPLAAEFFGRPSESTAVAGVTGTNGKTTVTYLLESMASAAGRAPGVIGTVSCRVAGRELPAVRTTPESVDLQRLLSTMRDAGCDLVAMEVTSHALDQGRVDGTRFVCAGFTNLTQDHLDYHGTMEAYFEAKAALFSPRFTSSAVVNVADAWGERLAALTEVDVVTYGTPGADLVASDVAMDPSGTTLTVRTPAGSFRARTALVGPYNVSNLLCATGLALAAGLGPDDVAAGAERLDRVPGRLEPVDAGQPFTVLVDYAHTPDALRYAVRAARSLATGRLVVVFGCGGDRDRGKRPLMGAEATAVADLTIITSDNPRSEDPSAIIAEIARGAGTGGGPWTSEPDRRTAIARAFAEAGPGDVVLIAGKGHETGQTFADRTIDFDDRVVARELLDPGAVRA